MCTHHHLGTICNETGRIGVALAFSSGAKDALIFDSLKELGKEKQYKSILGKLNTITFTIAIGSNIAAGFLANSFGFRLPLLLSSIFAGLSLINILWLTETKIQYKELPESTLWKHFKSSGRAILKNKMLPYLILFSMAISIGMKLSFHTLNPYWELMGVPIVLFGIALASHNALAAIISAFGHKIITKLGDIRMLWILLGIICLTFGLMSGLHLGIVGAIALSALFQIPRALIPITIDDMIQHSTKSHQRATVLSIHSFSKQGAQALMLPVFGYAADLLGLLEAFFWLAIILLILGILHLLPLQKRYRD
jgi:MFS family permease